MIDLENRWIDDYGVVVFREQGIMELLYRDRSIKGIVVESSRGTELFNELAETYDKSKFTTYAKSTTTVKEFDKDLKNTWIVPVEYQTMDIKQYLLAKCITDEEMDRVQYELDLFEEREMLPLLNLVLWLVNVFRANDIIWGIGRGSSVSSYCLYLIGLNKINPLDFDLDIEEFLK